MAGIAIVCSMAGVASGLALAATLMAVQIADRSQHEQRTTCWRRSVRMVSEDPRSWLGVEYIARRDGGHVTRVFSGTGADAVGLRAGDVILTMNGEPIDQPNELAYLTRAAGIGARPTLTVLREGEELQVSPRLTSFPVVVRY